VTCAFQDTCGSHVAGVVVYIDHYDAVTSEVTLSSLDRILWRRRINSKGFRLPVTYAAKRLGRLSDRRRADEHDGKDGKRALHKT